MSTHKYLTLYPDNGAGFHLDTVKFVLYKTGFQLGLFFAASIFIRNVFDYSKLMIVPRK